MCNVNVPDSELELWQVLHQLCSEWSLLVPSHRLELQSNDRSLQKGYWSSKDRKWAHVNRFRRSTTASLSYKLHLKYVSVINSFWTRESKILRFITQITADTRDTETMRLRHRIAFPPPRKPYPIGLLFTHKNGCGGAISVTQWSCARLLAISELRRELGRVSNLNLSINWHHHIKGHVEIGHLTKSGALRLNRDQVTTLETCHTNL